MTLVDCGASNNFISQQLVRELKLQVQDTPEFTVEMGNGDRERNKGVCKDLKVQIQGIGIQQNFFNLELRGTNLVLGMDWLASLGNIEANFKNLTIQWEVEGKKLKLQGDPSLSRTQASWKAMMKALHNEGEGFYPLYEDRGENSEQAVHKLVLWRTR